MNEVELVKLLRGALFWLSSKVPILECCLKFTEVSRVVTWHCV